MEDGLAAKEFFPPTRDSLWAPALSWHGIGLAETEGERV